jgi:outer membrane protein OmpA-like peptidoglycan-associated protein
MSFGRTVGGALLATGLAATMCVGTYWTAQAMQSDLTHQAQTTLQAHRLAATVVFSGRDAYVWADTPTARADAIAVLKTIPGVRIVSIGEGAAPSSTQASPSPAAATATATGTGTRTSQPTASASNETPTASSTASVTLAAASATAAVPPTSATAATSAPTESVTIPAWPLIHVDGNTANVDTAGKAELVQMAQLMVAHPSVKVLLTGYTDMTGTAAERQALGLARAKSAEGTLVAHGVSSSRIVVASRGGNDPIATNDTSQGRALNRRVTVAMTQEN